jgi:hypothetical protein
MLSPGVPIFNIHVKEFAHWRIAGANGVNTTETGRFHAVNRSSRMGALLPWIVVCVWLIAALFALGLFELRLPRGFWCGT